MNWFHKHFEWEITKSSIKYNSFYFYITDSILENKCKAKEASVTEFVRYAFKLWCSWQTTQCQLTISPRKDIQILLKMQREKAPKRFAPIGWKTKRNISVLFLSALSNWKLLSAWFPTAQHQLQLWDTAPTTPSMGFANSCPLIQTFLYAHTPLSTPRQRKRISDNTG